MDEEIIEAEDETMVPTHNNNNNNNICIPISNLNTHSNKSGSLESNFSFQEYGSCSGNSGPNPVVVEKSSSKRHHTRRHRHKRSAMGMQFQFEDCPMADILSSSSLSSSDSETDKTCDSDREGDDELTDWPGNEGVATLPGGRSKSQKMMGKGGLPLIKSDDTQDEDTRMSAEDMGVSTSMRMQPVVLPLKPGFVPVTPLMPLASTGAGGLLDRGNRTLPIDMPLGMGGCSFTGGIAGVAGIGVAPIESEMSGETSNHFLSSPNATNEVREFRAGCRRVREERPSFSVITSVNEDLSRWVT